MEGVNVFDRNGREIKLGDRVRISAEECNKFMHDWYAEAWIPEMHCAHDDFGTVVIQDGFAQIVNEHLPKRAAFEIENACHAAFKHQRIKGEFFDVDFKTACDKLATYSPITNCCTQVACHEY